MAEHSLRLKATLDTQEVQQELQKLRDMQNKAVGGAGNTGTAANLQLNNLTSTLGKLNATLGKLNASIAALQKSLGALTGSVNRQTVQQAALGPGKSQFIPPIAVSGLGGKQAKYLSDRFMAEITASITRARSTGMWKDPNIGPFVKDWNIDSVWNRPFGAPKFPRISRGPMLPGDAGRTWNNIEQVSNPEAQKARDQYVEFLNSRNTKLNNQMMNGIRGFAGAYMLGGLVEAGNELTYRDNPVMKPITAGAGAAAQGLNMGATMMMMGMSGPVAGIVGVGAALTEVIKAFREAKAEKILDLANALNRANEAWESMYEDFQKWDLSKFGEKVQGLGFGDLQTTRESARSEYDAAKKQYDDFQSNWASSMTKLDRQYFRGDISAEQYARGKEDLEADQKQYKKELKEASERLALVNAAYDAQKQALENFTKIQKEAANFDKKLNEFDAEEIVKDVLKGNNPDEIKKLIPGIQAKITAEQEKMAPIRSAGGLEAWEKQTNKYREQLLRAVPGSAEADSLQALIKSRDEAATAYKESAAEMMKAVGKSRNLEDAVDQLIKQMAELQKNADSKKAELARNQESAKNQYDQKWGRWKNEDLDKSAQKYQEQANQFKKAYQDALGKVSTAKTPEEQQTYLDEAEEAKKQWQFSQQEATSFGQTVVDRLREKLADLKTPDNTQVNSLASQGFMINKNDDEIRWKQQTDYASQQTQLQREIRDRLQQMDTASTFN